ncbi:MAG: hypothetical protein ACKV2U_07850, partial [Bryobacteraceae bacterium]
RHKDSGQVFTAMVFESFHGKYELYVSIHPRKSPNQRLAAKVGLAKPLLKTLTKPFVRIRSLHQFPSKADEPEGEEARGVGLAYGLGWGWGLLTKTPFGPALFKEGHGDGVQTYMICFTRRKACMILLTNSDNGERAFRPLLEKILGNTVTPWEWEGYLLAK